MPVGKIQIPSVLCIFNCACSLLDSIKPRFFRNQLKTKLLQLKNGVKNDEISCKMVITGEKSTTCAGIFPDGAHSPLRAANKAPACLRELRGLCEKHINLECRLRLPAPKGLQHSVPFVPLCASITKINYPPLSSFIVRYAPDFDPLPSLRLRVLASLR